MKLALIQMKTTGDPELNYLHARSLVLETGEADIVVLPEAFIYPFGSDLRPTYDQSIALKGRLSRLAAEAGKYLAAGTIPEVTETGEMYNTCYFFAPDGRRISDYRKVHLFDVNIPGQVSVKESDRYAPGNRTAVIDTPFGRLGMAICFDLRFPELWIAQALKGAQVMILPAAFSKPTGQRHWELLLRARACDSQCFVAGCAPAADDAAAFPVYGHSMVVDPSGTVLAKAGSSEEILYCDLDIEETERVRLELPVLSARRPAAYRNECLKG